MPSQVLGCLPRIFSRTMSLSALIGGARYPLAEEIESCIRQDRQAKCIQNLTVIIFCWSRDTVLLCAKREYLQAYLCIYNKNCRQANGDIRHIVPDVPTGLDRDIRDMPIGCAHPSRCKQTRSAYPDVPTGTFGTCKQVLQMTVGAVEYFRIMNHFLLYYYILIVWKCGGLFRNVCLK